MKSKELAVPLGVVSVLMMLFPKPDPVFEIPFFTPGTASENRIIGAVFFIGALILWYLPPKTKDRFLGTLSPQAPEGNILS